MSERCPAVQWYFRQFAGDEQVIAMTLQEVGAHILLICAAGSSSEQYRLPNNPKLLRSILRNVRKHDFESILATLCSGAWKVTSDGKWIEQDGLRRSFEKQKEFSDSQREKANKRWYAGALPPHDAGIAGHMPSSASSYKDLKTPNSTPAANGAASIPRRFQGLEGKDLVHERIREHFDHRDAEEKKRRIEMRDRRKLLQEQARLLREVK